MTSSVKNNTGLNPMQLHLISMLNFNSTEEAPRKVTKCGISITSEHRNITHWRIKDATGNVIEDKNFLEKK